MGLHWAKFGGFTFQIQPSSSFRVNNRYSGSTAVKLRWVSLQTERGRKLKVTDRVFPPSDWFRRKGVT